MRSPPAPVPPGVAAADVTETTRMSPFAILSQHDSAHLDGLRTRAWLHQNERPRPGLIDAIATGIVLAFIML